MLSVERRNLLSLWATLSLLVPRVAFSKSLETGRKLKRVSRIWRVGGAGGGQVLLQRVNSLCSDD